MSFADSNRTSLRYLAESVWATTPASGAARYMRVKSSKLTLKKDTKMSDEIRSDRMVPSIIETGAMSDGEVDFEFSAGAVDDFLAAFLYGAWTRPMTMDFWEANVAVASTSTFTISSSIDYSGYFTASRRVKLEGFKNPANNGYFQVSSVAHAGTSTTVTISVSTLVVEAASPYTKVMDANDVIVLASTAIRFGTAGASTIDSNSGNAFSAAIAAGQLKVGQKIFIDGLGYASGSVDFTDTPVAGDLITVSDGVNTVVFEFGTVASSPENVVVAVGADGNTVAALFVTAVNAQHAASGLNVTASNALHDTDQGLVTLKSYSDATSVVTKTGDVASSLTVTDFAGYDATLHGFFTVTSLANDVLGVTPKPSTNANSGTKKITVKGSMLRNPSVAADFVSQSFSIETAYEDVNQFFVNKGLRVGNFDLDVVSKDIVTGKIQFKGEGMERRASKTTLFGASPYTLLQATPGQVMSATTNVGDITKNGVHLATALKSISVSGDASLREQDAVGSKFPVGIGVGRFKLTGKFSAYFETGDMFDTFLAHETMSLSWPFTDLDGQTYYVTVPAIKLTDDPLAPGAIDQDVMEDITWEAQRDPSTNCMIQFDRFSSSKASTN